MVNVILVDHVVGDPPAVTTKSTHLGKKRVASSDMSRSGLQACNLSALQFWVRERSHGGIRTRIGSLRHIQCLCNASSLRRLLSFCRTSMKENSKSNQT